MSWKHMDWQSIDDQKEQMAARYRIANRVRDIPRKPRTLTEASEYCFRGCRSAAG